MQDFYEEMKNKQVGYKGQVLDVEACGNWRGKSYCHILPEDRWELNLCDTIREEAQRYFSDNEIGWHRDRHNMLSSQAMCVNIFFPLKQQLNALKPWLLGRFADVEKVTSLDFE